MAMRPTHDLMVKTGSYVDRDGNPKNRWLKIGSRFVRDDGSEALKLDCLPVGLPEWNGWVSVYPIKPREASASSGNAGSYYQSSAPSQGPVVGNLDDDIPF